MTETTRRRHAMKHTTDESPGWTKPRDFPRPMSFHKAPKGEALKRLLKAIHDAKAAA